MSKYFNPRLLNAVIAGTGMRNPVRPHVILGSEDGEFVRGDLMDANAIKEFINQKISDLVNNAPEALDTLKELADAIQENGVADLVTKGQLEAALNTKVDEEDLLDYVKKSDMSTMDANGHEYVEIGGIKWATMNIGANSVTDTGLYFQWGDTQGYTASQVGTDKNFSWTDYGLANGSQSSITKYNSTDGKTVLETSDDAVTVAWGGSWRMPTTEEFVALSAAVNTEWTSDYQGSGVAGLVCTDKTDSSKVLFFPACGYCYSDYVTGVGRAYYWSSSLTTFGVQYAYCTSLDSSNVNWQYSDNRYIGYTVRGVLDGGDKYATKAEVEQLQSNIVQADWNQADTTAKDYIKNKPTIPSIPDITAVNEALTRANNVNAILNGTVVTITNSAGVSNSVDLAAATDERVYITVHSSDDNMNVEDLTILVYYNMSETASETLHTDENGEAFVSVPNTTIYKIVFPTVGGYYTPPTLSYHAVVSQRAVDVVYEKIPQNDCEVTIQVEKKDDTVITKLADRNVYVTIGNTTTTYQTDSSGRVVLHIQHGQTYTVSTDNLNNYYLATDPSGSYTATNSSESILYFYLPFRSGLFIVAADGTEYAVDQWQEALANNTVVNSDAKLIKVATATLATNHGIFAIDIDEVCSGTLVKKIWQNPNNLAMESIPLNGSSVSALYYYDGKSASQLIQSEGDSRAIETPAVDEAMNRTVTINNQTINGFLGSIGQYSILQQNVSEIDGALRVVRPSTTRVMSNITENKWTSTQYSVSNSCLWSNVKVGDIGG